MKSIKFKEQNSTLTKPPGMTDKECSSLPVHRGLSRVISCWKMSFSERFSALFFGRVWLDIHTREKTHAPVALWCERSAFKNQGINAHMKELAKNLTSDIERKRKLLRKEKP